MKILKKTLSGIIAVGLGSIGLLSPVPVIAANNVGGGKFYQLRLMNFGEPLVETGSWNQWVVSPRPSGTEQMWVPPGEGTSSVPLLNRQYRPAGQIGVAAVLYFPADASDVVLDSVACTLNATLGSQLLVSNRQVPLRKYGLVANHNWLISSTGGSTGSINFPLEVNSLQPGVHSLSVDMDCGENGSATLQTSVTVLPNVADSEFYAVSINQGAIATNKYNAQLEVSWPWSDFVDKIMVSNDGGFAKSRSKTIDVTSLQGGTPTLTWMIDSDLPVSTQRSVYVRFHIVNLGWRKAAVSDDIYIDMTAPTITQASAAEIPNALPITQSAMTFTSSDMQRLRTRTVQVKSSARDKRSGVARLQVLDANGKRLYEGKYGRSVVVKTSSQFVKVRVRDGAGNWSKPKIVRVMTR